MRLIFLVLLSACLYVECRERRRIRGKDEIDDTDDFMDGQSNLDDSEDSYSRDYYRKKDWKSSSKMKYTRLNLDRKVFYYWDTVYEAWTNWTKCDPTTCLSLRNRKCKDGSWQEKVIDFRLEAKCPVHFIYERRKCTDVKECKIDTSLSSNNSTNVLPEKTCGKRPEYIETKIYGGRETIKNSWPWHGGLYVIGRYKSPIYICGATLINPGWAITAAHCLRTLRSISGVALGEIIDTRKNNFYNKFQLIFGDHDRSETERTEKVTKISHFIIHPSFRADYTSNLYDVALLKLDNLIPQQHNIDFACVPESVNYTLPVSTKCHAIGWGYVTSQDPFNIWSLEFNWLFEKYRKRRQQQIKRNANILQEVEIPLVDFKNCQRIYRIFNLQKTIHLCAGSINKDTCRGDSGGGLFCLDPNTNRWQLYGITNFGSARGCGKSYGVYVRVAALAKWIRDTLKIDIV